MHIDWDILCIFVSKMQQKTTITKKLRERRDVFKLDNNFILKDEERKAWRK